MPVPVLAAVAVAVAAVASALLLRGLLLQYESSDWYYFLGPWYRYIAAHGGFQALGDTGFSDYNVPYLYLMAALGRLPVPALAAVKCLSVLFDLALAYYTHRIVALRWPHRPWRPFAAAVTVLFLPTVVTNSGWWAQADAIFTAFLLGGVHHLLHGRPWWTCAFFGIALAFKLQAVFLFPLLLVVVLARRMPWRCLLAVPAAYLALDVPAVLLGADPWQLLTVYARQTGTYRDLTLNAPSVYQFVSVPPGEDDPVRRAGVLVAGALVLALIALAVRALRSTGGAAGEPLADRSTAGGGRAGLTGTGILLLATVFAIAVPFLLPSMHERYFYVADVLSVIVAFHLPRQLWYLPVLVQLASFGSYLKFIAPGVAPYLSMPAHGALMLLALVAVLRAAAREFGLLRV
ncbi:glycosyltransferase 87 family protein [Kitasatospora xanthocidica]|uniref:glycosyltransferase 87 family protein n=1 Tax=Kitasatospora xanthocidica TaxID=83382 RepID=UPI0011C3F70A|nr:glycosyltransferase 87 family protein [Kitasatospora xanthocidica]